MTDFGYIVNAGKQIDYDKNDKKISLFIKKREPSFNICISCGTCTATCTANNITDYNFRKLIVLIKRGETEFIQQEFEKCMLCGKCQIACPRGVNTRNILLNLKIYFAKDSVDKQD